MKNKMNACFKIGFIFLMVCVGLLAVALVFGYLVKDELICILFCAGGVLLAFSGIILVLCSKPKKQKPPKTKIPKDVDTDF